MRLLILSDSIYRKQSYGENIYIPPHDVHLDVGDPNETDNFNYSLFDYDISIIHIEKPSHHTIGYYHNISKISDDAKIALDNGLTVICIPESINFTSKSGNTYGATAYDWLKHFQIELKDNQGNDIRPSGSGMSKIVKNYLGFCSEYHQIVINPDVEDLRKLAVVGDTEIIIGMEYQINRGTFIIMPPPTINNTSYQEMMYSIEQLARSYFERARRRVSILDAPDWLTGYLVKQAIDLHDQIEKLNIEKSFFDRIAYVLYGSGDELEDSAALLLEQIGLNVEHQPRGANIDLYANNTKLGVSFAVEVTGIKGIIKKDSNKISQAWKHITDIKGSKNAKDKVAIVANTECHLQPNQRGRTSFSTNVVELLEPNGILLISTLQLYDLWKAVHEGTIKKEKAILSLFESSGLYEKKM